MKKILLLFLIIGLLGFEISAQTLIKNDIVGTWKVLNVNTVTELPKEELQTMEMLKSAFLKSKFQFEANQRFSFDFLFEEMAINSEHWKYNKATNSYIIQGWEDKDGNETILMEIKVRKENGKVFFFLSESFLFLEMKKE